MKLFGFDFGRFAVTKNNPELATSVPAEIKAPEHLPQSYGLYPYNGFSSVSFNGEKTPGEMGPVKQYRIDYAALRERSYALMLESDISSILIGRFALWVVGAGLKLQAEPKNDVLESEGVKVGRADFSNLVESRFDLFARDGISDYSEMECLHELAKTGFLNAIIGGDVLVILRYIDGNVNVQLVDGSQVETPGNLKSDFCDYRTKSGNRVRHGVEIDDRGKHIAYYVRDVNEMNEHKRIEATSKRTGLPTAFLVYGSKHRIGDVRGKPLMSVIMESASKVERYKEATLASAEERAKMSAFIEHSPESTGEDPFKKLAGQLGRVPTGETTNVDWAAVANHITATTNRQVINMPIGSKATTLKSDGELYFGPFMEFNINVMAAAIGIPAQVAMMIYGGNYSSNRGAVKDWDHTLMVKREFYAKQFYQPVYNFWLTMEIANNKIQAPGYLKFVDGKNRMALSAYRYARWIGASVPHMDPLKEVQAERAKLGKNADHIPLTTVEAATTSLNGGDSWQNMQQFAEELRDAEHQGIERLAVKQDARADLY